MNRLRGKVTDYLVKNNLLVNPGQVDRLVAKLIEWMELDEHRLEAAIEEID